MTIPLSRSIKLPGLLLITTIVSIYLLLLLITAMPRRTKNKRSLHTLDRQEIQREPVSGGPVIILLGQTGAGKSTFISVAGRDLQTRPEVGHGLLSCTMSVQEFQVENPNAPGQYVRLIDTPGFNDSNCSGGDQQLSQIIEWLKKEPQTKITGILFLHGIDEDRLVKDSTVVSPKDIPSPPGVLIVTTKWDASTKEDKKNNHERHLRAIFPSAPTSRFYNTLDSAWQIIAEIQAHSGNLTQDTFRDALEAIYQQFRRQDLSFIGKMKLIFRRMFV